MVVGLVLSAFLLSACAAGGGGAIGFGISELLNFGGGGRTASPGDAEVLANFGLGTINAFAAYDAGATGAGVTVAVIDTGIDIDHPDLDANILVQSRDVVSLGMFTVAGGSARRGSVVDSTKGHGTWVAGVIAAEKNEVGTQGVAFESKILALRADSSRADPACPTGCFSETDLTTAINFATTFNAGTSADVDVINLSLGGPGALSAGLQTAIEAAVDAGIIIVAASGNAGGTSPDFPAAFAGQPTADGLIIATGAIDRNRLEATFQNDAGTGVVRDFFVVAPGVDIFTTDVGGGFTTVSGTSFAAPHVSGALALLMDLFPTLTPLQAVDLILTTAADLGTAGTDDVFGRGLIDLAAALRARGLAVVPLTATIEGLSVPLEATEMTLGPAFGTALAETSFLRQAMFLDSYDRPYRFDLATRIKRAGRSFRLEGFVEPPRFGQMALPTPGGASLKLGYTELDLRDADAGQLIGDAHGRSFESLSLSGAVTETMTVSLGLNMPPAAQLSFDPVANEAYGLFWSGEDFLSPQLSLVGRGGGGAIATRIGQSTTFTFGWFQGLPHDDRDINETGRGSLAQLHLGHRFAWGGTVGIGLGLLEEKGSFLNSESAGAFGVAGDARSRFLTVSGSLPVGSWDWLRLQGSFTAGATEMPEDSLSLFSDFSTVRSSAFGVGLVASGLLGERDRLGLMVGQPLRVQSARVNLTLPVSRDLEGNVQRETRRLDLTPEGREIDLQLAYDHEMASGLRVSSWFMTRFQPGHDVDAAPDFGGGVRLRLNF